MVKIEPIDLIQKTNIRQHDLMISAINENKEEIDEVRAVEDIAVSDISTIKNNIIVLSNEKLDKEDIDKNLHIGNVSVSLEGTQAVATLDVYNPITGITTPISFNLPGATSSNAGVMTSSDVSWMQTAEERLAMLEGMSDVNAVTNLPSDPTQEQLSYGWTSGTGKSPETGDILQDVNNAKLWVFVSDTWILYGDLVIVPMASTSAIGGVRDTSLTAPGNRWYVHVEADGRMALIGGDALTTLIDTTIPALQAGVNNSVKKTGDETIDGLKIFVSQLETKAWVVRVAIPVYATYGDFDVRSTGDDKCNASIILRRIVGGTSKRTGLIGFVVDGDTAYSTVLMRATPGSTDVIHKGYLDGRLTSKQDNLTFDTAPTASSTNPVTSGGVKTALDGKADKGAIKTDGYQPSSHSSGTWITPHVSTRPNIVELTCNHQNFEVQVKLATAETGRVSYKNKDTANADGYCSATVLVPVNHQYKYITEGERTVTVYETSLYV